ncbi:MAG: glycosyltransferase family 2 protein, partial [Bacillota bacterium]
ERIRTVHQENSGASIARNHGLDLATGDYIMFVDSDDYVDSRIVEKLVTAIARTKADLAICGYARFSGQEEEMDERYFSKLPTVFFTGKAEIAKVYTKPGTNMFGVSIWAKLYRNDLIQSEHLRFDPSISYEEDCQFNIDYFEHIDTAVAINDVMYFYRQMEESLSKGYKKETFKFLAAGYDRRIDFVKTYSPGTSLYGLHSIFLTVIKNTILKISNSNLKPLEKIREYRALMEFDDVQYVAATLGKSKNRFTKLIQYLLPLKSGFLMALAAGARKLLKSGD